MELVRVIISRERIKLLNLEINYMEDRDLKKINKQFLGHNYYTDIITFDYRDTREAELLISLDSVRKNAVNYKTAYKQEFKRVIIHGMLHLAGFNDSTLKEQELIRNKENFYLHKYSEQ